MTLADFRAQYPQYDDMSDADLASALHRKYYSDVPRAEFDAKLGGGATKAAPQEPKAEPSEMAKLARAAGLTTRYLVEGPASLVGIVANPINYALGLKPFTQATSDLLTRAGLPQPETDNEKLAAEVSKALAAGGPVSGLAMKAATSMQSAPAMVKAIAASPAAEIASQGLGAGASEAARQSGAPEWAALAAGVLAPIGAQAVASGVVRGAQAGREILRPLTRAGRDQIAADTLGRIVSDKTRALSTLDDYLGRIAAGENVGVPGSKPTAGAVAADYGLVGGEQLIARGPANPYFAKRLAENNAARIDDLARLKATSEEVARLTQKRDAITAPLRAKAFENATAPVDLDKVQGVVAQLRASPAGGRQETGRALDALDSWIAARKESGRVSPEDAYGLHQDINDLIRGKVRDERGVMQLAGGMAASVKNALADEIEKVAPGFRRYLKTYSRLSRPIERLETISDRVGGAELSKVTNSLPQMTPDGAQYTLSQDKMRRAIGAINAETRPAAAQSDVLSRVLGDLNAETAALRGGKLPGSDTYQNIASANFLNRALGDSIAQSGVGLMAGKVLGVANRPFEAGINDAIVKAYLDPQEMRRLLGMARASRGNHSLTGLAQYLAPSSTGGLLGGLL